MDAAVLLARFTPSSTRVLICCEGLQLPEAPSLPTMVPHSPSTKRGRRCILCSGTESEVVRSHCLRRLGASQYEEHIVIELEEGD